MGNRERIVIVGDFNASIGRGGERRGGMWEVWSW